jgi:dipeptidyl-peptidase-4
MLKSYLFVGAVICSFITFSQKKQLTLDQAVLQQHRALGAETLPSFQWIPTTDSYTYLNSYTKLMKASVSNTKAVEIISIEEVNKVLNAKLNWFSGFEWKDKTTFYVNDGFKFYSFNITSKTGKLLYDLGETAENPTVQTTKENIAYTIENNLFVYQPDGKKIAITENADKNIVSGQTYARSEFGINNGIFWSPKGSLLAFAQKDESEVADYPLLNINTTPGSLTSIKYPMAGQKSEKPRIGIYNFATKSTVFILPQGKTDDYLTNVAWTPDEKFVIIAEVNRDQNHMWLNKYDALTGKLIKTLFEEKNDKWIEPEHPVFFPSETSNNFAWISERDGFNNIYYYDIEGKLIKQLTSNKFVVRNILTSINKGSEIVFTSTGENPLNTLFYSVSITGKQRLLTPDQGTHTISISPDGKWIFDEYSNHSTPSKSILLSNNGKKSIVLLEAANKLAEYAIGETEIGSIKNDGGTILYTRLIKPSNFDPTKKYPVMVYVYGGPHAQMITNEWLDGSNLWMHWMAEQGYLVFTLDNRGSGERGFEFESVIHRQCGTAEMEDQLAGVKYLKSLPYVDGNRLAVHGWSYGGFMTTSLMLRNADVFKVGVAGGPVTDWKYYEAMYGERYMDKPEENPEGYKQASLMNHASKLKGDLLLIHGTVDDVVVLQHNYALVKKFVELGIQMDYFPYPMHKHNVYGKDRVHLMTKVLNYIIENNK